MRDQNNADKNIKIRETNMFCQLLNEGKLRISC